MATKPILSYKDQVSLPPEITPKPLVRKRSGEDWANKTELTDFIDQLWVHPSSDTYLQAVCRCKLEYNYPAKEDVPATDFDCTCGREIFEYIDV